MTAPPRRVIAVCVDDVGLVDGVAETVVELAAAERVCAASCVTTAPGWRRAAAVLASSKAPLGLGLHFNLSEGAPLSAELRARWPVLPGLARLLAAAALRRLPSAAIGAEFAAQVGAFVAATGRRPEFIDGHQHVHALPGVREAVLAAIATWPAPPAVRNTGRVLGPGADFKRGVIEACGGRALQRDLVERGIAHNRALLGAYEFAATDYRRLMRSWLAEAPAPGSLLFCHPCRSRGSGSGDGDGDGDDAIAAARRREAAYFGSDAFAADLGEAGFRVGDVWARAG